jgi:hypothetical protein
MSTDSAYLTVAGLGVEVVYKDIKNLHISVYPPIGRVRVAAPKRTEEDTIRLAAVHHSLTLSAPRTADRRRFQRKKQRLAGFGPSVILGSRAGGGRIAFWVSLIPDVEVGSWWRLVMSSPGTSSSANNSWLVCTIIGD